MNNNTKTIVILVALTITFGTAVWGIDGIISKETVKAYAPKDNKAAEAERLTIPIRYCQFVKLIDSFKRVNNVSLDGMGDPVFNLQDGITTIDISKVEKSGRSLITGTNLAKTEWCSETMCTFKTEVVNNIDTVLNCPAVFMAKLVDDYEGSRVSE